MDRSPCWDDLGDPPGDAFGALVELGGQRRWLYGSSSEQRTANSGIRHSISRSTISGSMASAA